MKNSIVYMVILSFIFVLSGVTDIQAQSETEDDSPYWYVSHFKVPFAKIDSLESLVEQTMPVVEEAKKSGNLMDYRILIHHTGEEYNVVIMNLLPSWDAIDEDSGFGQAMEKVYDSEEKREEINSAFDWVFEGAPHKDNIYRDITYSK